MNVSPPDAKWLRLSEEKNALDYLERAAFFINQTKNDVRFWKWVVIALHGALYGFAIAACRGTNSHSVITKKGKLIGFWEALKRCQNPNHMRMLIHSRHLVLNESQKESIGILKSEFRNEFEHYKPKGWSIELHGMPQIAIDVLEVIRFLALETNTYIHLSPQDEQLVTSIIEDSIEFIKKSDLYREFLIAKELYEKGFSDNNWLK